METRRWTNPSQPQTLQIAVFLLYANAVLGLIFGNPWFYLGLLPGFAALVAFGAGGLGIANEKKWGYGVAVVAAVGEVAVTLWKEGVTGAIAGPRIIPLMFAVALCALLLHPQSRDYQRIWFS